MLPPFQKIDDYDEDGSSKIRCSLPRFLFFLLVICLAVIAAYGTWKLAYSFTNEVPADNERLMDEGCFATFYILFGYLWKFPEQYINDAGKKTEVYTLFEKFAHHRHIRNQVYFIDPMVFLSIVYVFTTIIMVHQICCAAMFKKSYGILLYQLAYFVYYFTLLIILFAQIYDFSNAMDANPEEKIKECFKKVEKF